MSYLHFIKWDYDFNIIIALVQALIASVSWFYWIYKNYHKRPHAWKIGLCFFILWTAGSLELWDFPPFLFLFDAHSLWHCATIPMYFIIWSFAFAEAKYCTNFEKEKNK